jgi:hypothetical protein
MYRRSRPDFPNLLLLLLLITNSYRFGSCRRIFTTTRENLRIEPAVMASEIERLPDLSGLLKLASVPDWQFVRLTPMTGAAPVRPRRPSVLTSPPTAGPAAVRTASPPAAVAPTARTKPRRARQKKAAVFRAQMSPRAPAAESSMSQGVDARVKDSEAASVQSSPGAAPGSIELTPLAGSIQLSGDEHFQVD